MGIILGLGLFAGVLVGIVVTIVLCVIAVLKTRQISRRLLNVWPIFAACWIAGEVCLVVAVRFFPFEHADPGSDYGIVLFNFFLKGLFYTAGPGLSAMLALLAVLCGPKTSRTSQLL